MNWLRKNARVLGIAVLVIIAGIVGYFTVSYVMENKTVGFYYPDYEYRRLSKENRVLKIAKGKTPLEVRITEEYMLGPMKYELRISLPEKVMLENVWYAQSNKAAMLVLSFNEDFVPFAENDPENCRWFIGGLIETLKTNTKVKKILLLVDNKPIRKKVWRWDLEFPIILKSYQ